MKAKNQRTHRRSRLPRKSAIIAAEHPSFPMAPATSPRTAPIPAFPASRHSRPPNISRAMAPRSGPSTSPNGIQSSPNSAPRAAPTAPFPGCPHLLRPKRGRDEVERQREHRHQQQHGDNPPTGTGIAAHQLVHDRRRQDQGRTRNAGKDRAQQSDHHDHQGHAKCCNVESRHGRGP